MTQQQLWTNLILKYKLPPLTFLKAHLPTFLNPTRPRLTTKGPGESMLVESAPANFGCLQTLFGFHLQTLSESHQSSKHFTYFRLATTISILTYQRNSFYRIPKSTFFENSMTTVTPQNTLSMKPHKITVVWSLVKAPGVGRTPPDRWRFRSRLFLGLFQFDPLDCNKANMWKWIETHYQYRVQLLKSQPK